MPAQATSSMRSTGLAKRVFLVAFGVTLTAILGAVCLAAIAVLRTLLNIFLQKEIDPSARRAEAVLPA